MATAVEWGIGLAFFGAIGYGAFEILGATPAAAGKALAIVVLAFLVLRWMIQRSDKFGDDAPLDAPKDDPPG